MDRIIYSDYIVNRRSFIYCSLATGGNQPLDVAAEGLRPRQLALISEKASCKESRQRGIKPQRKNTEGRKSKQHRNRAQTKPSSVEKYNRVCASKIGLYSHQRA